MDLRVVVLALAATSCTAAFRTSSGGAYTKSGVAPGTTNSIYVGDRGGLLTRASLAALGLVGSAGSVKDPKFEQTETPLGDGKVLQTTTVSGTFDPNAAQKSADLLNAAADPRQNFGGLSAGLEIASSSLGGDTSGWLFDFGWVGAKASGSWGLKGFGKLGFGRMTFHDRTIRSYVNTIDENGAVQMLTETVGDSTYGFLGLMLRLGVTYSPSSLHQGLIGELFVQADPNAVTFGQEMIQFESADTNPNASLWHTGLRVTVLTFLYLETKLSLSSMRSDALSYGLEVGLAL